MLKIIESFFKNAKIPPSKTPQDLGLEYENVEIESEGRTLKGWIVGKGENFLVLIHGWGANREIFLPLVRALHEEFSMLLFDVSNHGESSEYWPISIKIFWEDIGASLKFLRKQVILIGHSMGASSSIVAANTYKEVKGVVAISPFFSTLEITERIMDIVPKPVRKKLLSEIEKEVGFSLEEFSPHKYICKRNIPHLLIHGDEDETVPLDDSKRLKEKCPEVEFFVNRGMDHIGVVSNEKTIRRVKEFLRKF